MRTNIEPDKYRVVGCYVQYIIMCGKCVITAFLLCLTWSVCVDGWWSSRSKVSGRTIARTANKYIGSTKWSKASSHKTGADTNKCNIFVAEVLEEAGATVPQRHWYTWSPIGAGEWGNARSTYLTKDSCWNHVTSSRSGDVIGDGEHVGIVTGSRLTTSARWDKIVRNDFGFRAVQKPMTLWRYVC